LQPYAAFRRHYYEAVFPEVRARDFAQRFRCCYTGRSSGVVKTYSALLLFLALKAAGNSSMAWGMKQVPERMSMNPALYLRAMLDPFVALGVVALILALLTRMVLLSLADLSYVLPVTAVGYVIAVFLGKVFLHETVTPQRWLGTLLVFAGAAVVGSTSRTTTSPVEDPK
jgi:drug/metabolite transporter (DMT)-like permease